MPLFNVLVIQKVWKSVEGSSIGERIQVDRVLLNETAVLAIDANNAVLQAGRKLPASYDTEALGQASVTVKAI